MTTHSGRIAIGHSKSPAPFDAGEYWENRLKAYPGLCGVGNTLLGSAYIEWLYKMRRSVFLRLMHSLDFDYRASSVLDIGSGTGFYLKLWSELGARAVSGCDLTDTAVSRLQKDFPMFRIDQLDIGNTLPETFPGEYGLVSAFDVLFHIVDDSRYERALHNIHALLLQGGLFVFSDLLVQGNAVNDDHMVCRPLDDVVSMLQETGFEIIRRVPMFVVMEQPLDSRNRFYRLLWKQMTRVLRHSNLAGFVAGATLYPVDLLLTRICSQSPTTEIVLCRKRSKRNSSK
jgi:SAM-dependent methyltransferase